MSTLFDTIDREPIIGAVFLLSIVAIVVLSTLAIRSGR